MTMSATEYPHIETDDRGRPRIKGTGFKVVQIALDRIAFGWTAEEIQRQHADLTLSQVYNALAYYYDHRVEIDEFIEQQRRFADDFRQRNPEPPVVARLRALKQGRGVG